MRMQTFIKICIGSRDRASFTFFRIWTPAKPRPMTNDIWQSIGLDLVTINVYAIFQNIPHCSRDWTSYTFLEVGTRQSHDRWQIAFGNPLGLISINMYATFYQNIPYGWSVIATFRKLITDAQLHKLTTDGHRHWPHAILYGSRDMGNYGRTHRTIIGHTPKGDLLYRPTFCGLCNRNGLKQTVKFSIRGSGWGLPKGANH